MQTLYVDNIRGFSKTAVRFGGVTFLLGENSTGKSTLLSILHIINDFSMSLDFEFDSESHNLGGFHDLISTKSHNKKTFTIGLARNSINARNKPEDHIFFVTFTSDEGLPYATKLTYLDERGLISVAVRKGKIYYKIQAIVKDQASDLYNPKHVLSLAEIHEADCDETYKEIESPPGLAVTTGQMLFYAAHMIPNEAHTNRKGSSLYYYFMSRSQSVWIAPIRTKPKRTYDGSRARFDAEGSHVPYLLRKKLLEAKSTFQKALLSVGKEGNLFNSLKIKSFGEEEGSPFEVQVGFGDNTYSVAHVGYGVSQVLPIIAESISQPKNTLFYIQQPEVHLHPRAQASLGDLIHALATKEDKEFIIETHSDFLIDRFRLCKKRATQNKSRRAIASVPSTVLFFTRTTHGNHVTEIAIGDNGSYPDDQPLEFREFFLKEQIDLMDL